MWKQPMYLPVFHPILPMEWFTATSQEEPYLFSVKVTPIPLIWISSWKTESLSEDTSKGDIIFEKYEPETPQGTYQPFTKDQEVSFTLAKGRYYGNWFCPHADDMLLQFYHGNFNENEVLTNGYYLQLSSCYMHKLLDYNMENPPLEEGTYQVSIFEEVHRDICKSP